MKKLFHLLLPYLEKRIYHGRIRWLLTDKKGKEIPCYCCGNFANGFGYIKWRHFTFNIPFCKKHAMEYIEAHHPNIEYVDFPVKFKINIKYVPKPEPIKLGFTLAEMAEALSWATKI